MRNFKILSVIFTFFCVGTLIAITNFSPYNVWINSKISAITPQSCPQNWTFDALSDFENLKFAQDGNTQSLTNVILDEKYQELPMAAIGRVSTFSSPSMGIVNAGTLTYDAKEPNHGGGDRFIMPAIGQFEFQNSKFNIFNILASGLTHTKDTSLVVTGDTGLDVVRLDGCLKWSFPKKIQKQDNLPTIWRFIATDSAGETRTLDIQEGLKTTLISTRKIQQWLNLYNQLKQPALAVAEKPKETEIEEIDSHDDHIEKNTDKSIKTRILAWGVNDAGQLGNGLKAQRTLTSLWATEVEKILQPDFNIIDIDGGVYSTCLLRSDKTIWCWGGGNTHNQNSAPPAVQKVKGLPPMQSLEMGSGYTNCGKADNGGIWCWERQGRNARKIEYNAWTKSEANQAEYQKLRESFVDFYPGMKDACAVTKEGKLWCWGTAYSNDGDIYASTQKIKKLFPIEVPLEKSVNSVNVGFRQTCAILEDQSGWCWSNRVKPEPIRLFANDEKTLQVFSSWNDGCALKEDGTVWCWPTLEGGHRRKNSIDLKQINVSEKIPLTTVQKLENQGNTLFCALRKDTSIWCWGNTGGNPEHIDAKTVAQIKGPNGICNAEKVDNISTGAWSGYAIIKADNDYFKQLESADRSLEVFSSIQAGNFSKAKSILSSNPCLSANSVLAENALLTAIKRQETDIVKRLIDAGVDLELPHIENNTALLFASSVFTDVNSEIIRMLVDAGADINAVGVHSSTVLTNLQGRPKNKEAVEIVLNALQKKTQRTFYSHPPRSLSLNELKTEGKGCQSGQIVFSKAGEHSVDIPAECKRALVKVWGAGGGGNRGGTGGFTVDIINLSKQMKIEAIVGGAGKAGVRGEKGEGGFNGGGDGGEGGVQPDYAWGSGGGGGGRSEIIINQKPVVIAGGGGGQGRESYSIPGGGQNTKGFVDDYFTYVSKSVFSSSKTNKGQPGANGTGGAAGSKNHNSGCTEATPGSSKNGGEGARVLDGNACGAAGGGGGGAGYGGGGGGGRDSGGAGGGGAGLASDNGISIWGGMLEPANTEDTDYVSPNGNAQQDGLIVISWPAPEPKQLVQHLTKILPYQMEHRFDVYETKKENKVVKEYTSIHQEKAQPIRKNFNATYENYNEVPQVLRGGLRQNMSFDSYIQNIERTFSVITAGNNIISSDVSEKLKTEAVQNAIKQQRMRILNNDNNFDGEVTLEEVTENIERQALGYNQKRGSTQIDRYVKSAMSADKDNNGVITNEEMLVLDKKVEQQAQMKVDRQLDIYLNLDSNKDGVLTTSELRASAENAFSSLDLDKDSKISKEEYNLFRNSGKTSANTRLQPITFSANDSETEKITKTAALIKTVDAATSTFRDMYDALPGDMANAEKRIPRCKSDTCGSGNSDGIIGNYELKKITPYIDERYLFWSHLRKTDLLNGYDPDGKVHGWGKSYPASPIGGGLQVYSFKGDESLPHAFEKTKARKGTYLILTNDVNGDFSSKDAHFLTSEQAARLDRKLDDGMPLSGSVIAVGHKECLQNDTNYMVMKDDEKGKKCFSLFIRIH